LKEDAATVQAALLRKFKMAAGIRQAPAHAAVHRWHYTLADAPLGIPGLWDEDAGLGACGDWCLGARVESAFTSGRALAAMVLP